MFRITHNIKIGNYRYTQVNGLVVERSVRNLTGVCTITIPRNIKYKGTEALELIKKGDAVQVEAGYDDQNNLLFSGYVKQVVVGTPLKIECEDEMYALKQVSVETEHFPALQLSTLLKRYLPAGIKNKVQDVNLGEFRISNSPSLAKVLDYIKQNYGLLFYFRHKTLLGVVPSASLAGSSNPVSINFNIDVKNDQIKFLHDDDLKLIIKVKTVLADNSKLEVQEPEKTEGGEVHTFLALEKKTERELREYAKNLLATYKPGNLSGSLTIYGRPLIEPGDFVKLIDSDNAERNNKICQIERVLTKMGQSFLEQTITIGRNN
jgi:hypothetical protein